MTERLGLWVPGLAGWAEKDRPSELARNDSASGYVGSRYGSKASIETFTLGSERSPHKVRPSNTTV
jgi:hypothetical protein